VTSADADGGAERDQPHLVLPDLSPEARRLAALRRGAGLGRAGLAGAHSYIGPGTRSRRVVTRVWTGVINDGFIHAGNFAYMMLIALFPLCIVGAAAFSAIGEPGQRAAVVNAMLVALPPIVARAIEPVARSVIELRHGWLLWVGGLVGLWTVGSLIETVRDILRRAYGTQWEHGFWRYRLGSTALILGAMVLLVVSLAAQVLIGAAQQVIMAWTPDLVSWVHRLALSRFVPAFGLYISLYLLFLSLTPGPYRARAYPKWPGALFVAAWWLVVTGSLPAVIRTFFKYDLTYGSLAGIMISLFFFWLVGLGTVVGAELNAALAETPEERDLIGQADDRARKATQKP
jgi:membrane protein